MITDLSTHSAKYVHVDEFAAYLGETRRTIYHWIKKGAIKGAVKVGGTILIPTSEARAALKPLVSTTTPYNNRALHA